MRSRLLALRLSCAVLLLLATVSTVSAQFARLKNTTPEQRAKLQTELMKAKLDLTPDQDGKIAALNLKYAQKMEPVIKSDDGYFAELRAVKAINDEKEAELKQLLTPAQFDKYIAAKEEIREKFEERIGQ